jgi:hypothetical protein
MLSEVYRGAWGLFFQFISKLEFSQNGFLTVDGGATEQTNGIFSVGYLQLS